MDRRKTNGWKIIGWAVGLLTAVVILVGALPPTPPAEATPTSAAEDPKAEGLAAEDRTTAEGLATAGSLSAAAALPDPRSRGAKVFQGWAIDACHAPAAGTLRAWRGSVYRGVGVYFGGRGRHCKKQRHLTRAWARKVDGMGWHVLPIYVGSQSPCVYSKKKKHVPIKGDGWVVGRREGKDAVRRAKALGMRKHSALYLDMEAYNDRSNACARTTLAYIRGWSRETRSHGYFAGFYSSAGSGIAHVERARRAGVRDLPSVLWFARWRVKPALYGEKRLARGAWHPHRRIHQFAGNVTVKYGGKKLTIDRNKVDAPVAIIR